MRTVSLTALVLAALTAGCATPVVQVNSSELRVRMTDFRFLPAAMEIAAGRVKVRACNLGTVAHNARVEETFTNAAGGAISLGGTGVAKPGQCVISSKLTLSPGTYKLVDTVSNHADLGDFSTLIVR